MADMLTHHDRWTRTARTARYEWVIVGPDGTEADAHVPDLHVVEFGVEAAINHELDHEEALVAARMAA